jgi:hypothetical protein
MESCTSYINLLSYNTYAEPEYVFSECFLFFKEVLKCACDEITNYNYKRYIIFGPILNEIYEYLRIKCDYETKDFYKFFHYFFVILVLDKKTFESKFTCFLNENKIFFCQIKSKTCHKFNNLNLSVYQISIDTDEIQWKIYVFLLNKNYKKKQKCDNLTNILNLIARECGLCAISCFSGNQVIFYENKFCHTFIKKQIFHDPLFPFEIFESQSHNIQNNIETNILIYRNKFFNLYENIYKKFVQENKKINNVIEGCFCSICSDDNINFLVICILHCCRQEICLDCLSKMFLSNRCHLFVSCPFCRSCITTESYSMKY